MPSFPFYQYLEHVKTSMSDGAPFVFCNKLVIFSHLVVANATSLSQGLSRPGFMTHAL